MGALRADVFRADLFRADVARAGFLPRAAVRVDRLRVVPARADVLRAAVFRADVLGAGRFRAGVFRPPSDRAAALRVGFLRPVARPPTVRRPAADDLASLGFRVVAARGLLRRSAPSPLDVAPPFRCRSATAAATVATNESYDFANDATPSISSCRVTASMLMPASSTRCSTAYASVEVCDRCGAPACRDPCTRRASPAASCRRCRGRSRPRRSRRRDTSGFFVDVLAQSGRCRRAPRASAAKRSSPNFLRKRGVRELGVRDRGLALQLLQLRRLIGTAPSRSSGRGACRRRCRRGSRRSSRPRRCGRAAFRPRARLLETARGTPPSPRRSASSEKMSVTLMLRPSAMHVSIAGTPAAVRRDLHHEIRSVHRVPQAMRLRDRRRRCRSRSAAPTSMLT